MVKKHNQNTKEPLFQLLIFFLSITDVKLKAAGVPKKQAEVQAEAIAQIIADNLATKRDLRELELRITIKIGGIMIGGISLLVILMKLFHL